MSRNNGLMLVLAVMLVVTSAVFIIWPQFDIAASHIFWRRDHFMFQKTGFGAVFTVWLHYGMRAVFLVYVAVACLALALKQWPRWFNRHDTMYIIATVALAAGLVTNVILKDHWGRARPNQIVEFGGTQQFTAPWIISDQCDHNCSFVGGDVSFAFCSLAFALTVKRLRKAWIVCALTFGSMIAFGRIAAGAHFLSDCLIAAEMTCLICLWLYAIKSKPQFP